jgi:hypothetical protein
VTGVQTCALPILVSEKFSFEAQAEQFSSFLLSKMIGTDKKF